MNPPEKAPPSATQNLAKVRVNRKAADRAASGHPWIFSSDITDPGEARGGDPVAVLAPGGGSIGVAHYSSTSQIGLRLLSESSAQAIDRSFYKRRLAEAIAHRDRVVRNSDAYRVVFSEADLLPGLIVDRYGPYLVMQTLSQGMDSCSRRYRRVPSGNWLEPIEYPGAQRRDERARTWRAFRSKPNCWPARCRSG